jgi:uncharacterized membrane protein YsdA (DUF1294 family)/cold shock CspA family protein
MKGVIVKYDSGEGYGFIAAKGLEGDVFFHGTKVTGNMNPAVGVRVEFAYEKTEKGLAATSVTTLGMQLSPYRIFGATAALLIVTAASYLIFRFRWHPVRAYLLSINVVTFGMYGYDKVISKTDLIRVPEWILHGLDFLGGSPAGLLAQRLFRHKVSKKTFQYISWGVVVIQAAILAYLWWARR